MRPHLCQPGAPKSCAACCGLYNFRDRSQSATQTRVQERTEAVRALGYQDREALAAWSAARRAHEAPGLLLASLPTCPFAGDIGAGRVGCLVHPLVTGGPDLRDLGVYQSAKTCEEFLCPSFSWLRDAELAVLLEVAEGWYDYGLVITDVELLREVLRHLSQALGQAVDPRRLLREPARAAFLPFVAWKLDWPYRDTARRFGTFDVEKGSIDDIRRASIGYEALGAQPSPYDRLLLCYESVFSSASELQKAEESLSAALGTLARALESTSLRTYPA